MSYTNETISHAFFYSDNDYIRVKHLNLWMQYPVIYSYNTPIAIIERDVNNNLILLLSSNSIRNTTAKHINYIRRACPFDVVYYPFTYGNNIKDFDAVKKDLIKNLDYYKELDNVNDCKNFIAWFEVLNNLNNYFDLEAETEAYKPEFTKASELLPEVKKKESLAKRQATIKENLEIKNKFENMTAEEFENISYLSTKEQNFIKKNPKIILAKLQERYNYLDLIKAIFTRKFSYNLANLIKISLNEGVYSYIWLDDNNIKTSRGITQKIEDVKPFFKLWKAGKLKHGIKMDCYTVLEVTENFVKIGCHKIPVENLNAVYNVLFN